MTVLQYTNRPAPLAAPPAVAQLGNEPAGAWFSFAADQHFVVDPATPANNRLASLADLITAGVAAFTANSLRTNWGRLGVLETVAANVPRISYDPLSVVTSTATLQFRRGVRAITVSAGYTFAAGAFIALTDAGTPARWMRGRVISHVGTLLVVDVYWVATGISGSASAWTIIRSRGYLTEPSRTNLALRSAEFDNAIWSKVGLTVSANASLAPDGTMTADDFTEDTSAAHYMVQSVSFTSGQSYTKTIWGKERSGSAKRYLVILFPAAAFGAYSSAVFDLANGTVASLSANVTAKCTADGKGAYRCSATMTATATATNSIRYGPVAATTDGFGAYTGDGVSGLTLWGAQVEVGSYPTSYIATAGSQVTRSGDLLVMDMGKLPSIAGGEYSIIATGFAKQIGVNSTIASLTNSVSKSFSDCIYMLDNGATTTTASMSIRSGGASMGSVIRSGYNYGAAGRITFAGRVKVGNSGLSVNGSPAISSSSAVLPTLLMDRLVVGQDWTMTGSSSNGWGGIIESLGILPRALNDNELVARSAA